MSVDGTWMRVPMCAPIVMFPGTMMTSGSTMSVYGIPITSSYAPPMTTHQSCPQRRSGPILLDRSTHSASVTLSLLIIHEQTVSIGFMVRLLYLLLGLTCLLIIGSIITQVRIVFKPQRRRQNTRLSDALSVPLVYAQYFEFAETHRDHAIISPDMDMYKLNRRVFLDNAATDSRKAGNGA